MHTLPFLVTNIRTALHTAYIVVIVELLMIAFIRYKFIETPLAKTIGQVIIGGGIVLAVGVWLGRMGM